MVSNPQRRDLLADAGLRVLAQAGARGLTHRAVDQEAGVPAGTASNYFRSRDALLSGLAERIFARMAVPDAPASAAAGPGATAASPSLVAPVAALPALLSPDDAAPAPDSDDLARLEGRGRMADYLLDIVRRTTREPDLMRALFELRLEGARRPELGRLLAATLHRGYRDDVDYHAGTGLPGGEFEIALLHYALDGLLLDLLSTSIGADFDTAKVVEAFAARLVR